MAKKTKKKSHGKTGRRRSRRMGGIGIQDVGMKIVGIAAGAFLDNLAKKNFTSMNTKVLGAVEIGIGIFAPQFIKNKIVADVSEGFLAVGTINLLKGFSVISGVGAIPARVPLRQNALSPGQASVGAAGRPFLNQNVGSLPPSYRSHEMRMMGALFAED